MKLILHCRTCGDKPFITWEKTELTEHDCLEIINCSEHISNECDLYVKLYNNNGELLASIDEPNLEIIEQPRTVRWWEFWK